MADNPQSNSEAPGTMPKNRGKRGPTSRPLRGGERYLGRTESTILPACLPNVSRSKHACNQASPVRMWAHLALNPVVSTRTPETCLRDHWWRELCDGVLMSTPDGSLEDSGWDGSSGVYQGRFSEESSTHLRLEAMRCSTS